MNIHTLYKPWIAFLAGIIISFTAGIFLKSHDTHRGHHHGDTHPVGYANNAEEVHVHSDWLVHIDGVTYDFSADKYQTTATQELSDSIHLHDNNGLVIHRHADDVPLAEFLASLGFSLTDTCITTDEAVEYCSNNEQSLIVYVNGTSIEQPSTYVNQEEDRILIYYGSPADISTIESLQVQVTDQACIYSGTCPERGTPPPEACGITCEL